MHRVNIEKLKQENYLNDNIKITWRNVQNQNRYVNMKMLNRGQQKQKQT